MGFFKFYSRPNYIENITNDEFFIYLFFLFCSSNEKLYNQLLINQVKF